MAERVVRAPTFHPFVVPCNIIFVPPDARFLTLKCTKIDFGWGSAPDPAGGSYSAPPDLLVGFKGAYF